MNGERKGFIRQFLTGKIFVLFVWVFVFSFAHAAEDYSIVFKKIALKKDKIVEDEKGESIVSRYAWKTKSHYLGFVVSVTDSDKKPVRGLDLSNFNFLIDDKDVKSETDKINIKPIYIGDQGLQVIFVLDTSWSMEPIIEDVKRNAIDILSSFSDEDKVGVLKFGSKDELICPVTEDKRLVKDAINSIKVDLEEGSILRNALLKGIENTIKESNRYALIAIGDGGDQESVVDTGAVISRAKEVGCPIFFVPIGTHDVNIKDLQFIGDATGGKIVKPEEAPKGLYDQIAEVWRPYYYALLKTDKIPADGLEHTLSVTVKSGDKSGKSSLVHFKTVPHGLPKWVFLMAIGAIVVVMTLVAVFLVLLRQHERQPVVTTIPKDIDK